MLIKPKGLSHSLLSCVSILKHLSRHQVSLVLLASRFSKSRLISWLRFVYSVALPGALAAYSEIRLQLYQYWTCRISAEHSLRLSTCTAHHLLPLQCQFWHLTQDNYHKFCWNRARLETLRCRCRVACQGQFLLDIAQSCNFCIQRYCGDSQFSWALPLDNWPIVPLGYMGVLWSDVKPNTNDVSSLGVSFWECLFKFNTVTSAYFNFFAVIVEMIATGFECQLKNFVEMGISGFESLYKLCSEQYVYSWVLKASNKPGMRKSQMQLNRGTMLCTLMTSRFAVRNRSTSKQFMDSYKRSFGSDYWPSSVHPFKTTRQGQLGFRRNTNLGLDAISRITKKWRHFL